MNDAERRKVTAVVRICRGLVGEAEEEKHFGDHGEGEDRVEPGPRRGRKKTVRIWEWMVLRTSALTCPPAATCGTGSGPRSPR